MSNRLPCHIINSTTEARANRTGFHIEQQTIKFCEINARTEWRLVNRVTLPGLIGTREKCHEYISALQKRHASSGFDPQINAWWAHDMPEGAAVPELVYRWHLV